MTWLRYVNMVAWAPVLVFMAPAVWSSLMGRARSGDPHRLIFFCFAFLMEGYGFRRIIFPNGDEGYNALYVLSTALGIYVLVVARAHGRGPRASRHAGIRPRADRHRRPRRPA